MEEFTFLFTFLIVATVVTAIVGLFLFIKNRWKLRSKPFEGLKKVDDQIISGEKQFDNPRITEEESQKRDEDTSFLEEELAIDMEMVEENEVIYPQKEGIEPNDASQAKGILTEVYKVYNLSGTEELGIHREEPCVAAQPSLYQQDAEEEKSRLPHERGGRPRTTIAEGEKQSTHEFTPRQLKPEIICWKRERLWIIGVEIPEELRNSRDLTVLQNGLRIEQDESREDCWQLNQFSGTVLVRWLEDEIIKDTEIVYGNDGYLLFKLSGPNYVQGRLVKSPSIGEHLVITPENWNRDIALSGTPVAVPELVNIDSCQAHFFNIEKNDDSKIAFQEPTGKLIIIESKNVEFELTGTQIDDASENIGPLFGLSPPKIRSKDHKSWKKVGTIVVGEEGSRKNRWRKAFVPDLEKKEQDLPIEVINRKDGWYYLRFYDTNDELIDSLDFRFVISLRKIKIQQSSPIPEDDGHKPIIIELHHDPNFNIQPADDRVEIVRILEANNKTTLIVSPDPNYDQTSWFIGSDRQPQIQATFLVERIWWAISKEDELPSKWQDKLLTLRKEDFNARSNLALWVRFPRKRWINGLKVGFESSRARTYPVKVMKREVAIPLRDFNGSRELDEQDRDNFFDIWIERNNEIFEGSVSIIPASLGSILSIGWGRKKRATAKAVLREGSGEFKVNGKVMEEYFAKSPLKAKKFLQRLLELPEIRQLLNRMTVFIETKGSSPNTNQQVKASAHAIARALMKYDCNLIQLLERTGFGGGRVTERFDFLTGWHCDESNRTGKEN